MVLDDRINRYQALLSMDLAQIETASVVDQHSIDQGTLTRAQIDNYYKV